MQPYFVYYRIPGIHLALEITLAPAYIIDRPRVRLTQRHGTPPAVPPAIW